MGPDSRQQAYAAIDHAAVDFLDSIDRLGAAFHGDESGTRAVVRFEENVSYALHRLSQDLGLPAKFDDREGRHLRSVP